MLKKRRLRSSYFFKTCHPERSGNIRLRMVPRSRETCFLPSLCPQDACIPRHMDAASQQQVERTRFVSPFREVETLLSR